MSPEDVSLLPPTMREVYSSIVDGQSSLNAQGAVQQFRLAMNEDDVDEETQEEMEVVFSSALHPNVGANAYGVCLLVLRTMKMLNQDGVI